MRNIIILLFFPIYINAQWEDDFSLGNLSLWQGDTTSYIINVNKKLQLNETSAGDKFIYRPTKENDLTEWGTYFELNFAPSTTNKLSIYLSMDQADVNNCQAYFMEIGENGSNDNWKLYLRHQNKNLLLGEGEVAKLGGDPAKAYFLASRTKDSCWLIQIDYKGGRNYTEQAKIKDSLFLHFPNTYYGLQCTFTATRVDKFVFDDLKVSEPIVDRLSPEINSHEVINPNTIKFTFNEEIEATSLSGINQFSLNLLGTPDNIKIISPQEIELHWISQLIQNQNYTLTYQSMKDLAGNEVIPAKSYNLMADFQIFPKENDLIITEFMSDPDPAVGLPSSEFIEIFNPTSTSLSLDEIKISDESSISFSITNQKILPNEYLILCASKDTSLFKSFGRTIGISGFPTLNNDKDKLIIYSKDNSIIDQIEYTSDWHTDNTKSEGGYSIELIYPHQKCKGKSAWATTYNDVGGTAGRQNSKWILDEDQIAPDILSVIPISQWEISINANEALDIIAMQSLTNYQIGPSISIASVDIQVFSPNKIILLLNNPLTQGTTYNLTINNLKDCSGNVQLKYTSRFEIPVEASRSEILFNEILFNPISGGVDFIEFYNNSIKTLELKNLYINNFLKDNRWIKLELNQVSSANSYFVVTSNQQRTVDDYPYHDSTKIYNTNIVSMDDNEGQLRLAILKNGVFEIIDSLYYSNEWHNPLIGDESGVSLEKINPKLNSNSSSYWTSASASYQYGTPGLKNSQSTDLPNKDEPFTFESNVISPNQDGNNDQLIIKLNLEKPGYKSRIRVFDLSGFEISEINQFIVGTQDLIRWNVTDKNGNIVAPNNYIVVVQLVHPQGETKEYKKRLVVDYK